MNLSTSPTKRRNRRRGTALYITVLSTALIVSLLGLTGMSIMRIERRQASSVNDRLVARFNARSAVEQGLRNINADTGWRTTYSDGIETIPLAMNPNNRGTASFILKDTDGSLMDADTNLRLKGVGRVGSTVQVSSVRLEATATELGPIELRSMTSSSSQSEDDVLNDKLWCQYLKPMLPPDATAWWVTSVEFYCHRVTSNRTLNVIVYEPLPTNWPSTIVHDEVAVNSSDIGSSLHWHTFVFGGQYSLSPAEGICLAVTTNASSPPIKIACRSGGMSEPDSALIRGDPGWKFFETDKAMRYRVHGVYRSSSGGTFAVQGTWIWDAAPTP